MAWAVPKIWIVRCYKGVVSLDNKNSDITDKIVNAYFNKPNKTLKEIFEEYTVDFTPEETEQFYANLKAIIN